MQDGFICMVRNVPGAEKPEQTCGVFQIEGNNALVAMKVGKTHHMRWVPILPLAIIIPLPVQMDWVETEDNEKVRVVSDLGGGEQDEGKDE